MACVEIVDSEERFAALRGEWNILLAESSSDDLFLTWEWLFSWWKVFGVSRELRVVTIRDLSGQLIAILPLARQNSRYYRLPIVELAFLGTGLSDRQDIITRTPACDWLEEVFRTLHTHDPHWHIIRLEQVPADGVLSQAPRPDHYPQGREISSLCPYLPVSSDWGTYIKGQSRSFRRDISRTRDRISALGSWELNVSTDLTGLADILPILARIERGSRKYGTSRSFWDKCGNADFLQTFASMPHRTASVHLSTLLLNGSPIAYLLGFTYKQRFYAYNTAYIVDYSRFAPGKLVLQETIKWCFEAPDTLAEFDFLRGDSYLKGLWTEQLRVHNRLVYFNHGFKSSALRYFVFTLRPMLKQVVHRKTVSPGQPLI